MASCCFRRQLICRRLKYVVQEVITHFLFIFLTLQYWLLSVYRASVTENCQWIWMPCAWRWRLQQ